MGSFVPIGDDGAVGLRTYRARREEQEEARSWPARFRGWERTLRYEEECANQGHRTGDDYAGLCDVMAELLGDWAAEMESGQDGR